MWGNTYFLIESIGSVLSKSPWLQSGPDQIDLSGDVGDLFTSVASSHNFSNSLTSYYLSHQVIPWTWCFYYLRSKCLLLCAINGRTHFLRWSQFCCSRLHLWLNHLCLQSQNILETKEISFYHGARIQARSKFSRTVPWERNKTNKTIWPSCWWFHTKAV